MKYQNTDISPQIGDIVKFVDNVFTLIVEDVIDAPEKRKEWGLKENGIMLNGEKYGLVFVNPDKDPELEFVRRKE